jgi:hypothetical protein
MRLKLATWNMQHAQAGWAFLDRLGVDIAFAQEAVPPLGRRPRDFHSVPSSESPDLWQIGSTRRWASAVVSYGPALVEVPTVRVGDPIPDDHFYNSHPGALRIAAVKSEPPITVASLYGLMIEGRYPGDRDRFAITTVNRMLSDLTPLICRPDLPALIGRENVVFGGKRMVIGGDLNVSPEYADPFWRRHHQQFIERVKALGFVDCLEEVDCHNRQTFFRTRARPYQDDWIFARGVKVIDCRPLNTEPERRESADCSEHCPIVLTFETSA